MGLVEVVAADEGLVSLNALELQVIPIEERLPTSICRSIQSRGYKSGAHSLLSPGNSCWLLFHP